MSIRPTRRRLAAYVTALALAAGTIGVAAAPAQAAVACPTGWGSLAKSRAPLTVGSVTAVRAGRHACFDRLVFDTTGPAPGYDVRYVSTIRGIGSGLPIPVAGGAKLQIVVKKAMYTRTTLPNVAGYTTFRQVVSAGSFEGYTDFGLGVRARLPFRTFVVFNTTTHRYSLVVDVAHHW